MEAGPEDIQETIPETEAVDSYDELAAAEPDVPQKRGRGRPKGSRNKPKATPPPMETNEVEVPEENFVTPESPPPTPKPKPRKARAIIPPLEVEFDEGYGGAGPPKKAVRMRKPASIKPRAQSVPRETDLMHVLAAFAKEHGTREKERRRGFYEMYLP